GDLANRAEPGFDIRWVDPGRPQPHADFSRPRLRRLDIADLQDLPHRAVLLVIGCTHRSLPFAAGAYRSAREKPEEDAEHQADQQAACEREIEGHIFAFDHDIS